MKTGYGFAVKHEYSKDSDTNSRVICHFFGDIESAIAAHTQHEIMARNIRDDPGESAIASNKLQEIIGKSNRNGGSYGSRSIDNVGRVLNCTDVITKDDFTEYAKKFTFIYDQIIMAGNQITWKFVD